MKGLSRSFFCKNIISTFLIFIFSISVNGQTGKDTLKTNGIRLGFDFGGFAAGLAKISNQKMEFSGDVGYKKMFFVGELGFGTKNEKNELYNYKQQGYYARLGIDKNLLKGDDALFVGMRYGFSYQRHQADGIKISDPYWGSIDGSSIPASDFSVHWLEGVGGIKVKLFNNFYMGYTLRLKIKFYNSNYGEYQPFTVIGFGKPDKSVQAGMSYYIFYKIPFNKKKQGKKK